MLSSHSLPETKGALALSIFFATFIYEDGATLLAATLAAGGSLDPRIGLLSTFLGICMAWVPASDGARCGGAGCRNT